jgi:hypothetical protein
LIARLLAPKVHVSKTNIFARMIAPGVQALAYGMNLSSAREVAMILPLPVVPGGGEDAVKFVSLEKDPRMFEELDALFHDLRMVARKGQGIVPQSTKLVVHEVGAFIASYVPTVAEFARLDPRFRVPEVLFEAVPAYHDHGFAVFQLEPGNLTVHPMAFSFPTRAPDRLFFPTVHLHDGKWHATADFDHALYFQRPVQGGYEMHPSPRRDYAGLAAVGDPIERHTLRGALPNADTWINLS